MGYHDNHWKKSKYLCKNVESNVWTDFFNLQRRVMIQNLSYLTKRLTMSIEITEIIWICNAMGFFFKFGKQIEENIGFNI